MKGTQCKLGFLPEQQTDFIFSALGEEWGLIGSFFIIGLYFALILWGFALLSKQKTALGYPCFWGGGHALLAYLY